MSEIIVHGIPGSPYVRSVLLGLEEKGLDWRLTALPFGAHKSSEHLARQPFGRIPAVEHGDFHLYETQAILRYLDRIAPNPPLTPTDARAEARMNQICGITDWYVMTDISAPITFQRMVAPRLGLPVNETRIAEAIPKAQVCVNEIARLLGNQTYMAGEQVTIADLMVAPHLTFFADTEEGKAMLAPHARLRAWIERMNARPSLRATTWEALAEKVAAAA